MGPGDFRKPHSEFSLCQILRSLLLTLHREAVLTRTVQPGNSNNPVSAAVVAEGMLTQ